MILVIFFFDQYKKDWNYWRRLDKKD